jgi:hypothetical protein
MSKLTQREAQAKADAREATALRRHNLGKARLTLVEAKANVSRLEAEYFKAWNDVVSESLRESA